MEAINLQPFCDEPGGRFELDTPFVIGGWKYSTDGRVLVRVKTGEPDSDQSRRFPKHPEECLPESTGEWRRWPKVAECVYCLGHGHIDVPCHACGQDTQRICDCRKIHVSLGVASISKHYASLIGNLPNVEYATPADDNTPVRFRFDGGDGAICLLKKGE